jgi:hypothetical protein
MSKAQGITMRSGGGNKKAKKMAGALMFQRFPNGTMKLMKPEDSIDVAAANAEGNTPTFFIIPEVSQVMLHLLLASMYAPVEVVIGNDNGKKCHSGAIGIVGGSQTKKRKPFGHILWSTPKEGTQS